MGIVQHEKTKEFMDNVFSAVRFRITGAWSCIAGKSNGALELDDAAIRRLILNKRAIENGIIELIRKHAIMNPMMVVVKTFKITVPKDFDPVLEVEKLRYDFREDPHNQLECDWRVSLALSAKGYKQTLKPGRKYRVTLYGQKGVNYAETLSFLKTEGSLLVGAPGVALVYRLVLNKMPLDGHVMAIDLPEALPLDKEKRPLKFAIYQGEKGKFTATLDRCGNENDESWIDKVHFLGFELIDE